MTAVVTAAALITYALVDDAAGNVVVVNENG